MRKLTYYVAVSLDGFIAGPNGEVDGFGTVGDHMETIASEYPETLPAHVRDAFGVPDGTVNRHFDTVLMGRATYEPALAAGIDDPYPHLRTVVFSSTLPNGTVADPVDVVRSLKDEDGLGIWLCGGARLAGALTGEIDEIVVKRYPVALGAGIPMFATTYAPLALESTGVRRHGSGVVFEHYARAQEVRE